jgi:hypothetical protein
VAAIYIIGGFVEGHKTVARRKFDDLSETLKGSVYFETHQTSSRSQRVHTGYFYQNANGDKTAIEFLNINGERRWYNLHYSSLNQVYYAYDSDVLPRDNLLYTRYYDIEDPDHPDYIAPIVAPLAPHEEFIAGGLHHVATLAGPQSQLSPTHQILPYIEQAAIKGEDIPVDTQPIASTSQVTIQPEMTNYAQINTQLFGQQSAPQQQGAQQQQQPSAPAPPAQVAATNGGGALKGNPPTPFTGERSKSRGFLNAFNLFKETNRHNETMKNPYSRVTLALTYMTSDLMESWKEDQLQQLRDHVNAGTPDTDELHWQSFEADFRTSFTNTNAAKEACTELTKLKQVDSLDEYIARFKQLARLRNLPFTEHSTIEQFKLRLKGGLLDAIISSDAYDPLTAWTFEKWTEEAQKQHGK